MKKAILWGVVALTMFAFMGCGGDDDPTTDPVQDGPKIFGTWIKGLNNFVIQTGDNPGEVKYSFTATNPEADSYTLYYVAGTKNTYTEIRYAITGGGSEPVQPGTDQVLDLIPGRTYSFVILATKGSDTATSAVKTVTAKALPVVTGGKKLVVSGIPSTAVIDFVFIEKASDKGTDVVAFGYNSNGTFVLVEVDEDDGPNYESAWNGDGDFYITLANEQGGEWYYVGASGTEPVAKTIAAEDMTITIPFNQFYKPVVDPLKLTITGIPNPAPFLGAVLLEGGLSMENAVAIGLNIGGTVTFAEFVPGTWFGSELYGALGSYYIILPTAMSETAPVYFYIGSGDQPAEYNFTTKEVTIPFSQFSLQGDAPPQQSLTLTVTGITNDVIAAALFENMPSAENFIPDAFGTNNGSGTFTFSGANPGAYYIVLMTSMDGSGTNYVFTGGSAGKYTFTDEPETISFSQFMAQGGGETSSSLTLTVTGITGATIVGAALADSFEKLMGGTPDGFSTNDNGTFTFSGTSPGSYMITLLTDLTGQGTVYLYVNEQGPAVCNFEDEEPVTLLWQQFMDTSLMGGGGR
jgi:uncharacterized protein (DUF2141 family)